MLKGDLVSIFFLGLLIMLRYKASFILFLAVPLMGCENDLEKVNLMSKQVAATETAKKITLIYSDSAMKQVNVYAPLMLRFETPEPFLELPEGLKATFYSKDGSIKNTLTANYGKRLQQQLTMEVRNNVVVTNAKGEKLETEKLIWDERTAMLTSDVDVRVTTPDKIITGKGFEANQDFSWYKIKNVTGTFTLNTKTDAQNP
jgi:LPS export ABC transporter protein LptC